MDHLVKDRGATRIILWGNSMGAATILHYLGRPDIGEHRELVKIVILDSPFADLTLIVKTHVWGSSILTGCAKLGLHFINKKTK